MNHDAAHCLDYNDSCPSGCYRAELIRDLRDDPEMDGIPVSWSHLEGTIDCPKGLITVRQCTKCGAESYVVDTRPKPDGTIYRRRMCPFCRIRWTTSEVRVLDDGC